MSSISLSGVTMRYGEEVLAVDDIDIEIQSGEFVTLVGPSGCGKTTTLRTIAGFETPTAGTVSIDGEDVTDVPPYERNTGMVFQDFALFPHMTVFENIAYGMRAEGGYSDEEIEARVVEMLELVELPGVAERTPDQLSGGQQQRIALARALAPRPDALLLDEPLASLDKKLREQMQVELRRIQEEVGITTVFVTHNQEEALTMSDRLAVMRRGRFEQVGDPETLYHEPGTRFVADFLGTANLFDGSIVGVAGEYATVECDDVTVRARVRDGNDEGASVTVVARPERLEMHGDGHERDGAEHTNVFPGEVAFRRHLGSSIEYHVSTPSGRDLIVVRQSGTDQYDIGTAVSVTAPADDCRII